MVDISITIPRQPMGKWRRHIRNTEEEFQYYRLAWLPPQDKKIRRCYIIHRGYMIGYFRVKGFANIITGSSEMLAGRYVMLITASWRDIKPIKAKGHRSFRYLENIDGILDITKKIIIEMYEALEEKCQGK